MHLVSLGGDTYTRDSSFCGFSVGQHSLPFFLSLRGLEFGDWRYGESLVGRSGTVSDNLLADSGTCFMWS